MIDYLCGNPAYNVLYDPPGSRKQGGRNIKLNSEELIRVQFIVVVMYVTVYVLLKQKAEKIYIFKGTGEVCFFEKFAGYMFFGKHVVTMYDIVHFTI